MHCSHPLNSFQPRRLPQNCLQVSFDDFLFLNFSCNQHSTTLVIRLKRNGLPTVPHFISSSQLISSIWQWQWQWHSGNPRTERKRAGRQLTTPFRPFVSFCVVLKLIFFSLLFIVYSLQHLFSHFPLNRRRRNAPCMHTVNDGNKWFSSFDVRGSHPPFASVGNYDIYIILSLILMFSSYACLVLSCGTLVP